MSLEVALAGGPLDAGNGLAYKRGMDLPEHDLTSCQGRASYLRSTYDITGFFEACHRAFTENPDDVALATQYAAALELDSANDRSLSELRDLSARFSGNHDIRIALGLALMKRGRYREAWPFYGNRFARKRVVRPDSGLTPETRWQGKPIKGRSILLRPEQGLGDTLQFVRYAMNLRDLGARVYINPQPALRSLLQTSPALGGGVISSGSVELHTWSFILDLIPVFAETYEHVTWPGSYVTPPAGRGPLILPTHKDRPIRVGLAWRGSNDMPANYQRSLALEALAPLRDVPTCGFYSLMPASSADEIVDAGADAWITDLSTVSSPFEELARVVDAMDIVVTVCTSIAHLAGSMGKPVIILVSAAPDWRWGSSGSETRWYPSATLVRQSKLGDWSVPIAETRRLLSEL